MSVPEAMVYIVEDDPSFRKSIERLIRTAGYDVVSFDSARAFLTHACIRHPACLLLDVRLPDINGLDLQQSLSDRGYAVPIIFMTGHGTIPMSVQAMKKGAVDFLPKPFEPRDLLSAIQKALECDRRDREKNRESHEIRSLVETLTTREKEVLRWVIAGKINKQIAVALGTTEKTVKVHRGRVMQKMRVTSVAELVRLAAKINILPAE